MKRPEKTACRYTRLGHLVTSVVIAVLSDEERLVIVTVPWCGTGKAVGKWPSGFIVGDIPTMAEVGYFQKKFGFMFDTISRATFKDLNKLYLAVLEEATRVD